MKAVSVLAATSGGMVLASYGMGGDGNTANTGSVNTTPAPAELSAVLQGSSWNGHVTSRTSVVSPGFVTSTFTGGNTVGTHTIAAEFFGALVPSGAPKIAVEQPAATDIPNGGSKAFGTVTIGSDTPLTFTILNTGDADLNLTSTPEVIVGGTHPGDFTVTAAPTTPAAGPGSTTFTVEFALTASGARSATLTIANDDADEPSFVINVSGTGQTAYQAWATGSEPFIGDANGDDVEDGMAFLLGAATPGTDASGLLPTVTESGGDLILTFSMRNAANRGASTLAVRHSTDLGVVDTWLGATVPTNENNVSFAITPGSPTDVVAATIDSSAAGSGRLFGRLQGAE